MRIRNLANASEIVSNSKYLIENPEVYRDKWQSVFKNGNPICLEVGTGKGNFIIDMAIKNPCVNFVGLEKYTSVIARALQKCEDLKLGNLVFINGDALNLDKWFNKEIDTIYLNFSDPWPKKRHAKRRLTSEIFLSLYDKVFKDTCKIVQKTDNTILFESSIISLSNYGYKIEDISLDLWSTDKVYSETEYEHKFRLQGDKIYYLRAVKK
ncbi:MAG TPA: tRNA (guanosine(46)-N7)-methyltransferase TrmB [Firmicutes bacterium]|nr:tRNA (guanosine(46)-N7)-methyltransferase TrmB [Bacillota bacterium]